jgi:hypothetical protein
MWKRGDGVQKRETIAGGVVRGTIVPVPLPLAAVAGPVGCIRGERPAAPHDAPERKES